MKGENKRCQNQVKITRSSEKPQKNYTAMVYVTLKMLCSQKNKKLHFYVPEQ